MIKVTMGRRAAEYPMRMVDRKGSLTPGILLGLGLGGFFDGVVLHQVLQWHHMTSSAGYPPETAESLRINTFADGMFHAVTYIFVLAGVFLLWRQASKPDFGLSGPLLVGSLLAGFGAFNVIEGTINHHLLEIHHVNETAPEAHWIWWDLGFLIWGALMLGAGLAMLRRHQQRPTISKCDRPGTLG